MSAQTFCSGDLQHNQYTTDDQRSILCRQNRGNKPLILSQLTKANASDELKSVKSQMMHSWTLDTGQSQKLGETNNCICV